MVPIKIGIFLIVFTIIIGGVFVLFKGGSQRKEINHISPGKIAIIEYLPFLGATTGGFKKGLDDLGYREGINVVFEVKSANFIIEKLDAIATDLVDKNPDLIFANTGEAALAALNAIRRAGKNHIPIVYANTFDPIGLGLAQSFKSPGNNATGVINDLPLLQGKRLEFMTRINPGIKKVGIVFSRVGDPFQDASLAAMRESAASFGLVLKEYKIKGAPGSPAIEEARVMLGAIKPGEIDALVRIGGPLTGIPEIVNTLAETAKRLGIVSNSSDPKQGFIMEYSDDLFDRGYQAAQQAGKVLRGTNPSDIPLEYGRKYTLVINLKLARELGIAVPDSLLQIADTVYE